MKPVATTLATFVISIAFIFGAFACSSDKDPKVKADFENICNAAERSGAKDLVDASMKASHMAGWLRDNVQTAKAKKFLGSMATISPGNRASRLRDEAKNAGVEPCAFADEN